MSKTFPIELTEDLHKRIRIAAIEEGLTLHNWILKTLERRVGSDEDNRTTSTKRENINERSNRRR